MSSQVPKMVKDDETVIQTARGSSSDESDPKVKGSSPTMFNDFHESSKPFSRLVESRLVGFNQAKNTMLKKK
jgi:hypothetical protein